MRLCPSVLHSVAWPNGVWAERERNIRLASWSTLCRDSVMDGSTLCHVRSCIEGLFRLHDFVRTTLSCMTLSCMIFLFTLALQNHVWFLYRLYTCEKKTEEDNIAVSLCIIIIASAILSFPFIRSKAPSLLSILKYSGEPWFQRTSSSWLSSHIRNVSGTENSISAFCFADLGICTHLTLLQVKILWMENV